MGLRLFWKEKVARSFFGAILCLAISGIAKPQSLSPETITFSGESISLEEVFEHISSSTGLHFVYSSDMVDVGRRISLSFQDEPVENALGKLEQQMQVSFKRRGQHIIVKAIFPNDQSHTLSGDAASVSIEPMATYAYTPTADRLAVATAREYPDKVTSVKPDTTFSHKYVKKHFPDLLFYFDTVTIKNLPIRDIRKLNLNSRHRGWFFSIGSTFSNYSVGTELQFGVRNLYAVFVPNMTLTGDFQKEYGLGTSFLLSNNFSINPVFTYATSEQRETFYTLSSAHRLQFDEVQSIRDHRTKILIQYSPSNHINIRFGPVLNYSRIKPYTQVSGTVYPLRRDLFRPGLFGNPFQRNQLKAWHTPSREVDHRLEEPTTKKFSLGWELSMGFRLNFFYRR